MEGINKMIPTGHIVKFETLILICFIIIISLSSCNDSMDEKECIKSIKSCFPKSKIYQDPKKPFTYYVIDSIGMKKVTTQNLNNPDIDGITEFILVK